MPTYRGTFETRMPVEVMDLVGDPNGHGYITILTVEEVMTPDEALDRIAALIADRDGRRVVGLGDKDCSDLRQILASVGRLGGEGKAEPPIQKCGPGEWG